MTDTLISNTGHNISTNELGRQLFKVPNIRNGIHCIKAPGRCAYLSFRVFERQIICLNSSPW